MIYPKWRYHKTLPAVVVNDPEADEALGEGWADTPAAFEEEAPAAAEAKEAKNKKKSKE